MTSPDISPNNPVVSIENIKGNKIVLEGRQWDVTRVSVLTPKGEVAVPVRYGGSIDDKEKGPSTQYFAPRAEIRRIIGKRP